MVGSIQFNTVRIEGAFDPVKAIQESLLAGRSVREGIFEIA